MNAKRCKVVMGACMAMVLVPAAAGQNVVYDNTTTYVGAEVDVRGALLIGNEITLAGSERVVTSFAFALRLEGEGPATFILGVCFFGHDNEGSPHGGNIWCSPGLPQMIESGAPVFFNVDVPDVLVPDSFTWMIAVTNVEGNITRLGLSEFNPPAVGSGPFGYWVLTPGPQLWDFKSLNEASFGARVMAVGCIDLGNCDDQDVCTFDQCIAEQCTHTPNIYGDVDHDGDVDLFDLFCVLNGFSGDFSKCSFQDVDLEPCEGNASVDLFDLFAILNNFSSGVDPCCGGLP